MIKHEKKDSLTLASPIIAAVGYSASSRTLLRGYSGSEYGSGVHLPAVCSSTHVPQFVAVYIFLSVKPVAEPPMPFLQAKQPPARVVPRGAAFPVFIAAGGRW